MHRVSSGSADPNYVSIGRLYFDKLASIPTHGISCIWRQDSHPSQLDGVGWLRNGRRSRHPWCKHYLLFLLSLRVSCQQVALFGTLGFGGECGWHLILHIIVLCGYFVILSFWVNPRLSSVVYLGLCHTVLWGHKHHLWLLYVVAAFGACK